MWPTILIGCFYSTDEVLLMEKSCDCEYTKYLYLLQYKYQEVLTLISILSRKRKGYFISFASKNSSECTRFGKNRCFLDHRPVSFLRRMHICPWPLSSSCKFWHFSSLKICHKTCFFEMPQVHMFDTGFLLFWQLYRIFLRRVAYRVKFLAFLRTWSRNSSAPASWLIGYLSSREYQLYIPKKSFKIEVRHKRLISAPRIREKRFKEIGH